MSELYASMLMIGVTLSLGSLVAAAALGQFTQAAGESSLGASIGVHSAGTLVSLLYVTVPSSPSCPSYGGVGEGTTIYVFVFDYGSQGFAPSLLIVNSSVFPGRYPELHPGSMGVFTVPLGVCAHASGEAVVLADTAGEVFQFAS